MNADPSTVLGGIVSPVNRESTCSNKENRTQIGQEQDPSTRCIVLFTRAESKSDNIKGRYQRNGNGHTG